MVIKIPTEGFRLISSPRKLNRCFLSRIASWMLFTCEGGVNGKCLHCISVWRQWLKVGTHTQHKHLSSSPFPWGTGTAAASWAVYWWALGAWLKETWPCIPIFITQWLEVGREQQTGVKLSLASAPCVVTEYQPWSCAGRCSEHSFCINLFWLLPWSTEGGTWMPSPSFLYDETEALTGGVVCPT